MSLLPQESPRNRLSIAHLMLWTLGSAVILAFHRAILAAQSADGELTIARQINALIFSLLLGAEVGGVLLFLWRIAYGMGGFPTQPGHWLLLVEGVSALLVWFGQAGALAMERAGNKSAELWAAWQLPNCSITGAAYALLVLLPGLGRWWRVAFAVLSLQYLVSLAAEMAYIHSPPVTGLLEWTYNLQAIWLPPAVVLVSAVASCQEEQVRSRDFLHWTGVGTLVATQLMTVGNALARNVVW